jgi:transposase
MSDTELLLKSEPVRRLEVFTGAGRRRRWSAEQKAEIVAESYAGRESVSAVARRHGLTAQQLFGWRRATGRPAAEGDEVGLAFAPVVVDAGQPNGRPTIEIVIGTATIRVAPGADLATLQAVLRAVKALS